MRALLLFVSLIAWVAQVSFTFADALDRLQPDKLHAEHEAIEGLKLQRRQVRLSSDYQDVRTLLHVHSGFSHDSRGTIEEIIAAAKQAEVRVIMFSEHPSKFSDYLNDGHRGLKDGVLLIPGAETEGFLAYPNRSIQKLSYEGPQGFADLVHGTDGLLFLCHLEERLDWDIEFLTGSEIYNVHADFKDETRFVAALFSPLTLLGLHRKCGGHL